MPRLRSLTRVAAPVLVALAALPAAASSHREAPAITATPKVDATDFYAFRSYEPGRAGYVTFVADYVPLQDPYGGPNYFALDSDALYDVKVDNNGDAVEDLTFRFRFKETRQTIELPVGPEGSTRNVQIPLILVGPVSAGNTSALQRIESYSIELLRGSGRFGALLRNAETGAREFVKPLDNVGNKTLSDYESYAAAHVYDVQIPGCQNGRVFVGQRKDPFVVNLGEIFDLVNLNPLGGVSGAVDTLCDKNVTSLVLEVPIACLVSSPTQPIVGSWTTASLPASRTSVPRATGFAGAARPGSPSYVQVSRLSSPLVNEVVIGLDDKDRFNSSQPRNDAQFLEYVTHPTLPAILSVLFPVQAPNLFPRTDLVAAFLTGLDGLNKYGRPAEMLRLNTSIAPTDPEEQSNLGALGGDLAGFPNGRRPGDDVVDIELRVAMGALLDLTAAPSGQLPYTDGAYVDASFFDDAFPYLRTPVPGSPNGANEGACVGR